MSANIRETKLGFSKLKQADIATSTADADLFRMTKLNAALSVMTVRTENDALEIGKDDEFANTQFLTNWDVIGSMEKFVSSEFLGYLLAFGIAVPVVTNPVALTYRHTVHTQDPVASGIELPYFTYVEQIRPGGSSVVDRKAIGCAIEDFTITLNSGPGRQAAKCSMNFIGSGHILTPSTVTLPGVTVEHLMPGASAAITIIGNDYVAAKTIISLELSVKNNLRDAAGFFPGSGFQTPGDPTSGAVRGRLEFGDRQYSLKFVARFQNGSPELAALLAQTEGTGIISLQGGIITGATHHDLSWTFHRLALASAEVKDADGLVDVECVATVMKHSANGVLTAYVTNGVPVIG